MLSKTSEKQDFTLFTGGPYISYPLSGLKQLLNLFILARKTEVEFKCRTSSLIFSSGLMFGANSGSWVAQRQGSTGETRTKKVLS